MSGGAATRAAPRARRTWRAWCLLAAAVVAVVALVPPSRAAARRTEYAAALQFSLLAIVVPALVTLGAPWRRLRLAGRRGRPDEVAAAHRPAGRPPAPPPRAALVTRLHRRRPVVVVAWHAPGGGGRGGPARLAGARGGRDLLALVGLGLWLELVASPPLCPARATCAGRCWPPSSCGPSGSSPTWSASPITTSTALSTTRPEGSAPPPTSRSRRRCSGSWPRRPSCP